MTFWRGDTTGQGAADERPVVQVQVPAFHLDRTEVSTGQYLACVAEGACTPPAWTEDATGYAGLTDPQQPIVGVTWSQAGAFCAWRGGRLPTEVEWEAAATWSTGAAGPEDKRAWPWGDEAPTCARARFSGCGEGTLPVDSLPAGASAFGPLHLAGNAWEWTSSTYPLRRTLFRRQVTHYVLRGGAWDSQAESLRPTFRRHTAAREARPNTGFRCAR
ncbi:formylglycine-generating enzyme family protein [Myxococcota bacterium]|nr:formylglycine-generating enzyme family protein [Myxococcota bacterium]